MSSTHRTQLYLTDFQYRWLVRRAKQSNGSIAGVVRELIDDAQDRYLPGEDTFVKYLAEDPPSRGKKKSSVTNLDSDLYGK
jgi:hypothetical protein